MATAEGFEVPSKFFFLKSTILFKLLSTKKVKRFKVK